jgi:predicted deacylase
MGADMALSVDVLHGVREGPALWLSGAIHGDELDGIEIIHEVLDDLPPRALAGTVVAVPIVNLYGAMNESRYLPDRRDLNRSFPGTARGSLAGQLAHLFMREIVGRCGYGIDYHCGSDDRDNLPQVRGDLADDETRRLALAFAAPVTVPGKPPEGSLRRAAVKVGARVILYEGGEARRFTRAAIGAGVRGTWRVMAALGMTAPADEDEPEPTVEARTTQWLRAVRSGICRTEIELGQKVQKNQLVATIRDPLSSRSKQVRARSAGIVIGRRINPLVYRGEAVAHVAVT